MSRRRASTRVATDPATTMAAATITKMPRTRRNVPKMLPARSTSVRVSSQSLVPTTPETSATNASAASGSCSRRKTVRTSPRGASASYPAGSSHTVASPSG